MPRDGEGWPVKAHPPCHRRLALSRSRHCHHGKLGETRPNAPADTGGFTSAEENRGGNVYKYAARATRDGKIPTIEKLKGVCVKELNENHKEKLQCDVQKKLKAMGHSWIWAPAYCPWLQPIETFWAGEKNRGLHWNF